MRGRERAARARGSGRPCGQEGGTGSPAGAGGGRPGRAGEDKEAPQSGGGRGGAPGRQGAYMMYGERHRGHLSEIVASL